MSCNAFHRLIRSSEGLLPGRLHDRWHSAHASRCAECRAAQARAERLDGLMRGSLRTDAAQYVPGAVTPIPLRGPREGAMPCRRAPFRMQRSLVVGAAGLAGAAVVAALLLRTSDRGRPSGPMPAVASLAGSPEGNGLSVLPPLREVPAAASLAPARMGVPVGDRDLMSLDRIAGYRPRGARRMNSRAGTARSRPAPIKGSVREGGLRALLAAVSTASALPSSPAGSLQPTAQVQPRTDDFVTVLLPRIAAQGPAGDRIAAEAAARYQREVAVVDSRLARPVSLAMKATALSDLCEHLRGDTGIALAAGQSVADEKVTLFCKQMPLRDVMRQLSRPFGYAWLRSGKTGEYKYELVQDLRSQLLEEELRNRDRNEALLALDREIERYRPYVGLSPDELLARASRAAPAEKKLLERLAKEVWGPVQIYFRLSARDLAALRVGRQLRSSPRPGPDEPPMPSEVARRMLETTPLRDWRVLKLPDGFGATTDASAGDGLAPASVPEVHPSVELSISQTELGQFTLKGASGLFSSSDRPRSFSFSAGDVPIAVGESPAVLQPNNAAVNSRLAADPALRRRVTVRPQASCGIDLSPQPAPRSGEGEPSGVPAARPKPGLPSPLRERRGSRALAAERTAAGAGPRGGEVHPAPRVTTADVLEALYRASGISIAADYYTRLYPPAEMTVQNQPLFDAVNRLADGMHLRWNRDKEGNWLQFRSTSFFHDRTKEVPNASLSRWAALRRQQGSLTLDDLIEIAQLSDAQLDAASMAEGAKLCFGLEEWDVARRAALRPHLRYLASFTPEQRREATSSAGLPFTRMSLAQQQQFIAFAVLGEPLRSLEELGGAALRVDYTQPGSFRWAPGGPTYRGWVMLAEPGREGRRSFRPLVRERTREAALQAVRRVDPQADPAQIAPTELDLAIVYLPGVSNRRPIHALWGDSEAYLDTF